MGDKSSSLPTSEQGGFSPGHLVIVVIQFVVGDEEGICPMGQAAMKEEEIIRHTVNMLREVGQIYQIPHYHCHVFC